MLRWDGHFKYKFGIIHIKIVQLRSASYHCFNFCRKAAIFSLSGLGADRLEIWFRMRSEHTLSTNRPTGSVLVAMGS